MLAQQPPAPPPPPPEDAARARAAASISSEPVALLIAGFDADGDARVTRAEFDAGVARSFPPDAPAEGLSLIGLSNWSIRWLGNQGALPGQFDFDADGDDRISRAEYAAELGRRFDRFDANRDGALDRAELVVVRAAPVERDKRGNCVRLERQDRNR